MVDNTIRPLAGKVAMVTGSARRIGRATAIKLAEAGADVVVHAHTARDEAEAVVREIEALGVRSHAVLADVADETAVLAMADEVLGAFGNVDILVNNAAIRRHRPFEQMSYAEWREILGVILDGAFLCSRAFVPSMRKAGGGIIVNIGGVSAHVGAMERAHVSAAKAGVVGLTRALAVELADAGIRVNCVAPGKIGGARSKGSGEGVVAGASRPLLPREGTIDEAAGMIAMMCMPVSGFMTGQTVHVNGGMYLP